MMARVKRSPTYTKLASICALVLAAACGYAPVDPRGVFGADVRAIELQMFENRSTEIGLEAMLADAFQEEFVRRGLLKPLYQADDESSRSQLVLSGTIVATILEPTAFSSVELSLEDRIDVVISLGVQRRETGQLVLDRRDLRFSERFLASADPNVYESNKEQALRRISTRAASQLHDELFQQF